MTAHSGSPPLIKKAVLIVEDSKAILMLLKTFLERLDGIEVIAVATMKAAEDTLNTRKADIFCSVLDLNLADAPNGEVVDLVQSHDIPVVVLTGSVNTEVRDAMRARNVVDFVIKRNAKELEQVAHVVERIQENQLLKVLIVDDSRSYREYLRSMLENYRYQVLEAEDGQQALAVMMANPDITLVITDYHMPKMNGMELIEQLRSKFSREEMAIIAMTDHTREGFSSLMLKAGANDFLHKSFEIEEFYCRVSQTTDTISYIRKIRDAATRDYLTQSYNRRHFYNVGQSLYLNAKRGSIKLAAAMIDADHFKNINDTYGHDVGDQVLIKLARTLEKSTRESDLVARFGGEEFACLAVIKSESDARLMFERVRKDIESIQIELEKQTISVTASIGITTCLSASLDDMMKLADQGVYAAKEGGRNQVAEIDGST